VIYVNFFVDFFFNKAILIGKTGVMGA